MRARSSTRPDSSEQTLVQFLHDLATRFGERDALVFKPGFRYRRWTYQQLWDDSGKVAALLQERGVGKGDRVVLWAPNSPFWVLSFFGIIRAGAVVVPLDLRSPSDFVDKVISRTEPVLSFVSRQTPDDHDRLGLPEIFHEDLEGLYEGKGAPTEVAAEPDDLLEIMFTSGTTGDPKGVMLTHRNLVSNVVACYASVPPVPDDRFISILPLSHMLEQTGGLLLALYAGASITYPTSRQPSVLSRTIRERQITLLQVVPLLLDVFMKGIEREAKNQGKEGLWKRMQKLAGGLPFPVRRLMFRQVHAKLGGHLLYVISGGAALDSELAQKWERLGVHVIQGYGATEAAPVISIHTKARPGHDSAGLPLPGVEVTIADDDEILVRGPNVTPGYWQDEAKTAESFEDGWYKTGDLGSFDDRGHLYLKGRKKDMIVLPNGENVYAEDVETTLMRHPSVKEAVVVGLATESRLEVHAALLMEEGPGQAADAVSWANDQLADRQRVRGHTVWPEEDFPRTHTMKVRKGVVLEMLQAGVGQVPKGDAVPTGPQVAEAPPVEQLVANVVGRPVADLRPDMTLAGDLELDSLGRVEILLAVEGELGVYLDESSITEETTIQDMAALVEEGSQRPTMMSFPSWGMQLWCRIVRGTLQRFVMFPLTASMYKLSVTDTHHLESLEGPVVFASNHHLYLDNPLIIKSMPSKWRRQLAIAGAAELWNSPVWSIVNPLLGNAIPLAKEGAVRPSLENLGHVLDKGWSVLIYPEGKLSIGGPLAPFMNGTGLVAVEGRVPIVPMRLNIHKAGVPGPAPFLRRGHIEIKFGGPIRFEPGTNHEEATAVLQRAVKSL
jgi:long-chain acyl-CoA synthetase